MWHWKECRVKLIFWCDSNLQRYVKGLWHRDNIVSWARKANFCLNIWNFRNYFLSLQHRLLVLRGKAGGLILWERRFRTSVVVHNELRKSVKPQQTDDNRSVTLSVSIYLIIYSSFWRGLISVVYPVWFGQCEGLLCQDGQRSRHLRLFCIIS